MERSKERITKSDLKRLLKLSEKDMIQFFERNKKYSKQYNNKHVLVALCQGAALHYIDKKNGVKDFDVWFFYLAWSLTRGATPRTTTSQLARREVPRCPSTALQPLKRTCHFLQSAPCPGTSGNL